MVLSKIYPSVVYDNVLEVHPEDSIETSQLYEMEIKGVVVIVAIGREQQQQSSGAMYSFYPIYLIKAKPKNHAVRIGLFEINPNLSTANALAQLPPPLLYPYITAQLLAKIRLVNPGSSSVSAAPGTPIARRATPPATAPPTTRMPSVRAQQLLANVNAPAVEPLGQWVNEFLNSSGSDYDIIDNEGNGDCFFAVIRDAITGLNKQISVQDIRKMVAAAVTDEVFETHREFYNAHKLELKESKADINRQRVYMKELAAQFKASDDLGEKESIRAKAIAAKAQLDNRSAEYAAATNTVNIESAFMKNVKTTDGMRAAVLQTSYWADSWTVPTLEREMNLKFILLSSQEYDAGNLNGVINCGQATVDVFEPDFYIMMEYTGNHYRLITHRGNRAFTFDELPAELKTRIANTCLRGETGAYVVIPDFKALAPIKEVK